MSDQDALLAAIRQAPDDDAPRLVYADWLDEHGDPDQAEFIRVQVEIDPYRRADSDLDRWRLAVIDLHLDRPVPADFPAELRQYAELARREAEILKARKWKWVGPVAAVNDNLASRLTVAFRRGFAEEVALTTAAFLEGADDVRSACPMLRRLTLYGPRDQVHELAGLAALGGIPELELAGWITEYDSRALSPSFALRTVQSLTLWIGSRHDADVIRNLANRPWDGGPGPRYEYEVGPHLPELRELVLVQLHGGLMAGNDSGNLDRRANELAGQFNRILGRAVARVERPYARRFPLHPEDGYGLFAGRVRGRPTVICAGRSPVILQFDADGGQTHEDILDLDGEENLPPVLRRNLGFEPGPVFVREFESEQAELSVYLWGTHRQVIEDPDGRSDGDDHMDTCAWLAAFWMKGGHFVILIENTSDYWADPDGTIQTT
jgi:uncharacterized protein (TIGR02996 family)